MNNLEEGQKWSFPSDIKISNKVNFQGTLANLLTVSPVNILLNDYNTKQDVFKGFHKKSVLKAFLFRLMTNTIGRHVS